MVSLKFDFIFDEIGVFNETTLLNSTCIWIIHANKIPPHLGLSVNGKFFSLKVKGKDENVDYKQLINIISNKQIGTFIISLKSTISLPDIENYFTNLTEINEIKPSCLTPINELIIPESKVKKISALLEKLKVKGEIASVFSLYLDKDFRGIRYYSEREIQERIKELAHVERKKHLPPSR